MATVLIIDDDQKLLALVERAFRYEGFEVDSAPTGPQGLELLRQRRPDIVVLDIGMPGIDGFETLQRVRRGSDVPVVMLTARDEVADKVKALRLGADDYLAKPFAFDELLARIQAVLRRREVEATEVLSFADVRLDLGTRQVTRGDRPVALTAKEFDLLAHFLRNPRRVLTHDVLRSTVWGFAHGADTNVVAVTVGHLRKKLGDPWLVQTVRGVGYALRE